MSASLGNCKKSIYSGVLRDRNMSLELKGENVQNMRWEGQYCLVYDADAWAPKKFQKGGRLDGNDTMILKWIRSEMEV